MVFVFYVQNKGNKYMYDKVYSHDVDNYIVLRVQKRESICSFPIRFIWLNDISSYLLSSWNGFYSNKIVSDVHKSRVLTKSQKQVIKINISHERKEDKKIPVPFTRAASFPSEQIPMTAGLFTTNQGPLSSVILRTWSEPNFRTSAQN